MGIPLPDTYVALIDGTRTEHKLSQQDKALKDLDAFMRGSAGGGRALLQALRESPAYLSSKANPLESPASSMLSAASGHESVASLLVRNQTDAGICHYHLP